MFVFTQLETGSEGTGYFTFCFMLCHTFQGQCLRHAQNCVKQARLVYLQIHLISAGIPVINLEPNQVRVFIETHDKFHEVSKLIIALSKMLILGLFVWHQSLLRITPCDSNFHYSCKCGWQVEMQTQDFSILMNWYAVMSVGHCAWFISGSILSRAWLIVHSSYMAMSRSQCVFLSCCKCIFMPSYLCSCSLISIWSAKNQKSITANGMIRSHIVVVVFIFQSPTAAHTYT